MLKSHKNALLETIQEFGLETAQFSIVDKMIDEGDGTGERNIAAIRFNGTELFFFVRVSTFDHDAFSWGRTLFAPGNPVSNWLPERTLVDIHAIQYQFSEWLLNVVNRHIEEEGVPDFWKDIGSQLYNVLPPIESGDVDQFTASERKVLHQAMEQIRDDLSEALNPTEEQLRAINEKLDYMNAAIDRLNKMDWKGIAVSTMLGIITTMSVDTATGGVIFRIFKKAFAAALTLRA